MSEPAIGVDAPRKRSGKSAMMELQIIVEPRVVWENDGAFSRKPRSTLNTDETKTGAANGSSVNVADTYCLYISQRESITDGIEYRRCRKPTSFNTVLCKKLNKQDGLKLQM